MRNNLIGNKGSRPSSVYDNKPDHIVTIQRPFFFDPSLVNRPFDFNTDIVERTLLLLIPDKSDNSLTVIFGLVLNMDRTIRSLSERTWACSSCFILNLFLEKGMITRTELPVMLKASSSSPRAKLLFIRHFSEFCRHLHFNMAIHLSVPPCS